MTIYNEGDEVTVRLDEMMATQLNCRLKASLIDKDIVSVKKKREYKAWINLYDNGDIGIKHNTREQADIYAKRNSAHTRLMVMQLKWIPETGEATATFEKV